MAARPFAALAGVAVAGILALGAANWAAAHVTPTGARPMHCHYNGGGPNSGPTNGPTNIDQ